MVTYSAPYPSKTSWQLQLVVTEGTLDPVGNDSVVSWDLYIYRGNSDTPFNNSGSAYSVTGPGGLSGTFHAYRFGASGSGTDYSGVAVGGRVLIASGSATVSHNPNGTGSVTVAASHAAAATLGTASITSKTFTLATLTQAPGTPTGVTGSRVDDTHLTVAWTLNDASNGVSTQVKVQQSVNGGAYADAATISPASSVVVAAAANRKTTYKVLASNSAGASAYSTASAPVYTTPAAPTGVAAAKDVSANIVVSWTPHVAFTEHQHIVEHGTITGGVTTWDGSPLATVAAGTSSYSHATPNPAQVHVYRVSAKNTSGALQSSTVLSNTVQLLAAPNKPTITPAATYQDKSVAFVLGWVHNPVDTTPQAAYKVRYSTDGGSTWTTTSKQTSTGMSASSAHSFALSGSALTLTANEVLTLEVQTWGQATSGGSDSTGASPWSDPISVTFKTKPVATITTPADSSTYVHAALNVVLGFSQAESASFVSATIQLFQSTTLLETVVSTTLAGTLLSTPVADGVSYTLKVTVLDSNGITSSQVTSGFSVAYTVPVAAAVAITYDVGNGWALLSITIPEPGDGEEAAVSVTVSRTILGVTETLYDEYPIVDGVLPALNDTTPTIHGINDYQIVTWSEDGAATTVTASLETVEDLWAYLSTGNGWSVVVSFFGDLKFGSAPAREKALVQAAGRSKPIALFGEQRTLEVSGSATLIDEGSTPETVEAFILDAELVCYRDPSGRRIFGVLEASLPDRGSQFTSFEFKVTEAS